MSDTRVQHRTIPSILNIPTEPFHSASHSLYGPRGPVQAAPTGRRARKPLSTPPASLEEHVADAISKVPDLSSKQKLALRNTFLQMCRDISFIRMLSESAHAHGPWSEQAAHPTMDSQGNVY
jgi:hypothetical protein